jgi:peptidoglycan/LPS O-acetylase OafA/YrhL
MRMQKREYMNPLNPLPIVVSLLAAIATSSLLLWRYGSPKNQGKYASIDGIRGYLAFFVFLHHSCVWYFYLRTGNWQIPKSNIYAHFGKTSVLLFFMITGFLFYSKLLNTRTKNLDWGGLYLSRFLRLAPLYWFVITLQFIIVAYISRGRLNEPMPKLFKEIFSWISFTFLGALDINGVKDTSFIVAGVTWSLPYEWLFYFSLPFLALSVGIIPPVPYLIIGSISFFRLVILNPHIYYTVAFLTGIIASILVRWKSFCVVMSSKLFSFLSIACIMTAVYFYSSPFDIIPMLFISVFFIFIACGNDIFGLLSSQVSRIFGEMAYSIYLLHGMLLFLTFNFVLGIPESKTITPLFHWMLIVGVSPILVVVSFFSFRFIESPTMKKTELLKNYIQLHLILPFKLLMRTFKVILSKLKPNNLN